MEEYKIKLIKEKYGVDLRGIEFKDLSLARRLQWGRRISELEQQLVIDRFHELIKSPPFDSMKAYKKESV